MFYNLLIFYYFSNLYKIWRKNIYNNIFYKNILYIFFFIYIFNKYLFFIKNKYLFIYYKINILKKYKINILKKKLGSFVKIYKKKIYKKKYNLILRLKRKNLFLTFLDKNGNVLFKNNIGSFGFKDKVKFTGYALENTALNFCKKIQQILKKRLSSSIKKFWGRIIFLKEKYMKILKKAKIFFLNLLKINKYFHIIKNLKKKNIFYNVIKYRKYNLFNLYNLKVFETRLLENYLFMDLILKNNTKYWAFYYILTGLSKIRLIFSSIKDKRAITHSKGFRLKKPRRV